MRPIGVRVGTSPQLPATLAPLLRKLHDRMERTVREVNSDAIPGAVRRELRMFLQLLREDHGHSADWVSATLDTGNGTGERYEVP